MEYPVTALQNSATRRGSRQSNVTFRTVEFTSIRQYVQLDKGSTPSALSMERGGGEACECIATTRHWCELLVETFLSSVVGNPLPSNAPIDMSRHLVRLDANSAPIELIESVASRADNPRFHQEHPRSI